MFGFKRLRSTHGDVTLTAPASGPALPLDQVPDPVFSKELVGPGFAIEPTAGPICAPTAGTLTMLPDTLHAFGLRTPEGIEVLVHVGIDSVELKGEGFTALRAVGDTVEAGTPVLEIDLPLLTERLPSLATPVIVTRTAGFQLDAPNLAAARGEPVVVLRKGA